MPPALPPTALARLPKVRIQIHPARGALDLARASGTATAAAKPARAPDRTLYVDRALAVLNKPPGWIGQPDRVRGPRPRAPRDPPDLSDVLEDVQNRFGLPNKPYPVHRLDKKTTGAYLLALTLPSARALASAFRRRVIRKTYVALVFDPRRVFRTRNSGEVSCHLRKAKARAGSEDADGQGGWVEMGDPAAEDARERGSWTSTAWRVLAFSENEMVVLLELTPLTGFKHQLRVHCAKLLGAPILGDDLYAAPPPRGARKKFQMHAHMYLHAASVTLTRFRKTGPRKALELTVHAPLPSYWAAFCRVIGLPLDGVGVGAIENAVEGQSAEAGAGAATGVDGAGLGRPVGVDGANADGADARATDVDADWGARLLGGGVAVDGALRPDGAVPELDGRWVW